MPLSDLLKEGGTAAAVIMTVVQILPVKIVPAQLKPWTFLARALGRAINGGDVMQEIRKTQNRIDVHIADGSRARILRFNGELLRDYAHTKEEFDDVLSSIDEYERYCRTHPDYRNNRANCAIANIKDVYAERMKKKDFL